MVQPSQIEGLSMSVDWYSIEVKDTIGQISAAADHGQLLDGNLELSQLDHAQRSGNISRG